MNPSNPLPSRPAPLDEDLAEQARPGHGVPSQDPNPAAQILRSPEEIQREADSSVLTGGGAAGGAALGATIGVAVAGPLGVVVGATLGAVAGAAGGAASASVKSPKDSNDADRSTEDSTPVK